MIAPWSKNPPHHNTHTPQDTLEALEDTPAPQKCGSGSVGPNLEETTRSDGREIIDLTESRTMGWGGRWEGHLAFLRCRRTGTTSHHPSFVPLILTLLRTLVTGGKPGHTVRVVSACATATFLQMLRHRTANHSHHAAHHTPEALLSLSQI